MTGFTVQNVALVAAGGAIGAVARFAASAGLARVFGSGFPVGTLIVNVVGCAAAGIVLAGEQDGPPISESTRAFVVIGMLGGFTTFSTFSAETLALYRKGEVGAAAGNVVLNVALCLVGVAAGWALGRWLRA